MTQITIGDDTVEVRVDGDAGRPALLLSNSLGTDLSVWDPQMPVLLQHFRVVRYDTRGHGGSTLGSGPISIARLGQDALAILDALDIHTAHVLGLSMGGAVAQWLLLNAPGRIDRAVLANTAAKFGTPDAWNERIALVLADGMDQVADRTMKRWFSDGFREAAPDEVTRIHDAMRAMSPAGYAACCATLRDMDLREAMRGTDRPVLVVTGRDDPVVDDRDTEILLSGYGARHVDLDARHLSNVEAVEAFNEAIVSFLTAKAPARRAPARPLAPRKTRKTAARSSAARSPLKDAKKTEKAATKAATSQPSPDAKKPGGRKAAAKAPVSSRRSLAAKPTSATRPASSKRATIKASKAPAKGATRSPVKSAPKAGAKKPAAKITKTASAVRRAAAAPSRVAGKTATTKRATAKTVAKKAEPKKAASKKTVPKKAAPKKAAAKKTVAKRAVAKKAVAKKTAAKKAVASKASVARRKPPSKSRGPSPRRRP